jgi:hypothetical protein
MPPIKNTKPAIANNFRPRTIPGISLAALKLEVCASYYQQFGVAHL